MRFKNLQPFIDLNFRFQSLASPAAMERPSLKNGSTNCFQKKRWWLKIREVIILRLGYRYPSGNFKPIIRLEFLRRVFQSPGKWTGCRRSFNPRLEFSPT